MILENFLNLYGKLCIEGDFMAMIPAEISDRLYKNVYVCMKCNARIRTNKPLRAKCRKCGSKQLRPVKKGMKMKK